MRGANHLSREQIRGLKKAVHLYFSGFAAEQLLADSVRKDHDRLALYRYIWLYRIDADRCAPYERYCEKVAKGLTGRELDGIYDRVDREFTLWRLKSDVLKG